MKRALQMFVRGELKTYEIIHLETSKVLQVVEADGFTTDEHGVVTFYKQPDKMLPRIDTAITQISASTLIVEKKTPQPALVVPFPEDQCTKQS